MCCIFVKFIEIENFKCSHFVPSRSSSKPLIGKGNKRDHRKRTYSEDDELDPMDPSSYSDAPRGGWYVVQVLFSDACLLFYLHL